MAYTFSLNNCSAQFLWETLCWMPLTVHIMIHLLSEKADFCTWYNHLEMIPMVKSGRVSYRNVIRCVIFWSDPSLCSLLISLWFSSHLKYVCISVFVQIKPMGLKPSSLGEADEFRKQRLMMWEGMEISGFPPDESEPQMCKWECFFNTLLSLLCLLSLLDRLRGNVLTSTGLFLLVPQRTLFFLRSRVLESRYNIWRYYVCCIWCLASLLSWLKKGFWNILAGF